MNIINIDEFQNFKDIYCHIEDNKIKWCYPIVILKQLNDLIKRINNGEITRPEDSMRVKMVLFVCKICKVYKLDNQDLTNARCYRILNEYLPTYDTLNSVSSSI